MMKKSILLATLLGGSGLFVAYGSGNNNPSAKATTTDAPAFDYIADRFADIQVLRYEVRGWETLSLQQKKLAYYLYEAGLSGRDIFYDQKYRYGLTIRKTLEAILNTYQGERAGKEWADFETYAKRFFFSNGNHHHYGAEKMMPGCRQAYFTELIRKSEVGQLPLDGREPEAFTAWIVPIVFDPKVDAKEVDLDAKDVIVASCNNFYSSVTQQEVETYYDGIKEADTSNRSQIGFNTRLVKENGLTAFLCVADDLCIFLLPF